MIINYLGHASFKLKGKAGTVVTDPYNEYVGWSFPSTSADVVTVSHDHPDHNQVKSVNGTARREKPFVIDKLGEYEVDGISVFGVKTFHDAHKGGERGTNNVFTIYTEGLRICHLGDLGHELTSEQVSEIGSVDVLLCPVGGVYTIDPKTAVNVIRALEPSIVIPMHYKTPDHNTDSFADLATVGDFLKEYGVEVTPDDKLTVEAHKLPEETEVVVLTRS